jgi:hypothetical protein
MTSELYIASEGPNGPVKIGRSVNAGARLASLQTGNPRPLKLIYCCTLSRNDAVEAERNLLADLQEFALVGEWLDLGERFMADYIADFLMDHGYEVAA